MGTLRTGGWCVARLIQQWEYFPVPNLAVLGRVPSSFQRADLSPEYSALHRIHSQSQPANVSSPSSAHSTEANDGGESVTDSQKASTHEASSKLEIAADNIQARRREYWEQVSAFRKKYAAERAEKERQSAKAAKQAVEEQSAQTAVKLEARKERSLIRQQEVAIEQAALAEYKRAERQLKAERKKVRDEIQENRAALKQDQLRQKSAYWIEEADLENSISRAMNEQFHL